MALQHAPIALLCEMRLIRQLVILTEVLTRFAACHPVGRQHVNPHLWRWLAVHRECFLFPFPGRWQTVCMMACWHAVYRRSTDCPVVCVCVWAALDDEHSHIFRWLAFYRCSQKLGFLQGHMVHHLCLKRSCGQVYKVCFNNTSHICSHLTQPVNAIGQKQRLCNYNKAQPASSLARAARWMDCFGKVFLRRVRHGIIVVFNQDTCVAATFGQKLGFPAGKYTSVLVPTTGLQETWMPTGQPVPQFYQNVEDDTHDNFYYDKDIYCFYHHLC